MGNAIYITTILQDILMSANFLLALIYSLLIIFIPRFHHPNNMFILNICIATIGCSSYMIVYFTMFYFNLPLLYASKTCIILFYTYNIASIQVPFAFVTFSIHRFCSIVYYSKPFFKTKRWVIICITSYWIAVCLISLPFILRNGPVSYN